MEELQAEDLKQGGGAKPLAVLLANPHLTISYEQDTQILFCRWHRRQSVETIQNNGGLILEKFKEKKAHKILNDNLEVEGQWEDAIDWTTGYWFPAMTAAGLKYFAWVLSKDIFARVSAKRSGQRFNSVRFFRSHHYAYEWLRELQ